MADLLAYEPEPEISPIVRDAFFDALNPRSSTAIAVKEDGSVAIKANQPPPEAKPKKAEGRTEEKTKGEDVSPFTGFGPALAALGGGGGVLSEGMLRGLTPEQIVGLMNVETSKQRLRQGTIGQLLELPYRQALTAKALRPEAPVAPEVPVDVRTKAMEALTAQRLREPAEPEPKALKERMYQEADGEYWWGLFKPGETTPTRAKLRKATKRDLEHKEIEVSGLPREKFDYAKLKRAGEVREIILANPGYKENKGRITEANEGVMEPTLIVWDTRWGNEALECDLPEGFVADHFTPTITNALGEGKTIRVRHPVTGEVVKLRRKGGRFIRTKGEFPFVGGRKDVIEIVK